MRPETFQYSVVGMFLEVTGWPSGEKSNSQNIESVAIMFPKSLAWFKALGDSATCWNPFVLSWHKQGQTHSLLVESPVMRYVSSVFASKDRVSLTFMFRTFGFKKQPLSIKGKCWWFWLLYQEVLHFPSFWPNVVCWNVDSLNQSINFRCFFFSNVSRAQDWTLGSRLAPQRVIATTSIKSKFRKANMVTASKWTENRNPLGPLHPWAHLQWTAAVSRCRVCMVL